MVGHSSDLEHLTYGLNVGDEVLALLYLPTITAAALEEGYAVGQEHHL